MIHLVLNGRIACPAPVGGAVSLSMLIEVTCPDCRKIGLERVKNGTR